MNRLRTAFATPPDPYAGADMEAARRLGSALWLIAATLVVVLFPLSPPTEQLGASGWAVAAATALALFALSLLLRSSARLAWDHIYATSFGVIGGVVVLQWLAGGIGLPYDQLLLLPVLYTAVIHPPRRIALVLLTVVVVLAAPLAYAGWDADAAASSGVAFVIWTGIAAVGFFLMQSVRNQRLALRDAGELAREEARCDELTGLGNRRAFDETVASELTRTRVLKTPLSMLLIDIECFKQINDRWGHVEGDRCLRNVAETIRRAVRQPDLAFRWGGDEFALLLPGVDLRGAEVLSERLKAEVAHLCSRPDDQSIGIRCGVAEATPGLEREDFLELADRSLTEAKLKSPAAAAR